mgnify:CR=1 FL=1
MVIVGVVIGRTVRCLHDEVGVPGQEPDDALAAEVVVGLVDDDEDVVGHALDEPWQWVVTASLALIAALFAIVYRFLPRTAIGWKDVWIGAAITAALFTLGRVLLGVYFTYASPGSAYGAAGSVVALLVWVNFSSQLALFGAEFTYVWTHTHGSRAPDPREDTSASNPRKQER